MVMRLVLLGPPGVGKGTQAAKLAGEQEIAHISTGGMFREAVAKGTALGHTANEYMASGKLVPDAVVIGMVEARLQEDDCRAGFLLDGFPRTIGQAQALDALLERLDKPLTAVIDLNADEEELIRRLSGRRVCAACGATYHVDNKPPAKNGICDICGGELIQREDDCPEAIRRRLIEYKEKTSALTQYYAGRGLLEAVDASGSVDGVYQRVQERLKHRLKNGAIEVSR